MKQKQKRKRKVFVVNKSSHDYSAAKLFGELVFMTEGSLSRFACSRMNRIFELYLENSSEDDYLLISGMNIMCSLACGLFASKHGRLNLLIFNKSTFNKGNYVERTVVFN